MDTCFLFTKYLSDEGCYSLKLSTTGELVSPPALRNFAELHDLQKEARTIVVETCENASLLELELPWLTERKARIAIPYALEDKVAQQVDDLHFAFDKNHYRNNKYLVTVISKQRLQLIMQWLDEHRLDFEAITLDWFALDELQLAISENVLLINNDDFKGCLSGDLARTYIKRHSLNQVLVFQDSSIPLTSESIKSSEHSFTWIAQGLLKRKPLNLCQGDMQHGNDSDWIIKGYQLAGALFAVWLFSLIMVNALALYSINKQTAKIDEQIATIYHQFFPEAKQVISPKFRIKQLLENNTADGQTHFWFVLNQFAKAVKDNPLTVEQLRYQNKTLSVTIVSADFASLEALEKTLKNLKLKVKQTQASTRNKQVVATLELM